ncbi:hypothetical protein JCM11641_003772 [Rhodosporidiobolus odoratus]
MGPADPPGRPVVLLPTAMPGVFSQEETIFDNAHHCAVEGQSNQLAAAAVVVNQIHQRASPDKVVGPRQVQVHCIGDVGISILRAYADLPYIGPGLLPPSTGNEFIDLDHDLHRVGIPTKHMPLEMLVWRPNISLQDVAAQQSSLANACTENFRDFHGYAQEVAAAGRETRTAPQGESRMLLLRRAVVTDSDSHLTLPDWHQPYVRHELLFNIRPAANLGETVAIPVTLQPYGIFLHARHILTPGLAGSQLLYFALERLWVANDSRHHQHGLVGDLEAQSAVQAFFVLLLVETSMQAHALIHFNLWAINTTGFSQHPPVAVQAWSKCLIKDVQSFAHDVLVHHAGDDGPLDTLAFLRFRQWILDNLLPPPLEEGGISTAQPGSGPWILADRVIEDLRAIYPAVF